MRDKGKLKHFKLDYNDENKGAITYHFPRSTKTNIYSNIDDFIISIFGDAWLSKAINVLFLNTLNQTIQYSALNLVRE